MGFPRGSHGDVSCEIWGGGVMSLFLHVLWVKAYGRTASNNWNSSYHTDENRYCLFACDNSFKIMKIHNSIQLNFVICTGCPSSKNQKSSCFIKNKLNVNKYSRMPSLQEIRKTAVLEEYTSFTLSVF